LNDDLALVQSVDFFTPIVDDAYSWGAIAAANALSDVYAMGGKPLLALNLVGWPKEGLSFDLLADVLEGGADKVMQAGAHVVGGHTIDDAEPKFGMAVTGTVHPEELITSAGAEPEQDLVLTKPLGMGIISTAIKRAKAPEALIEEAIANMSALNDKAAAAMVRHGASAATDVTGFGFLGHLHQMLKSSGVGAEIESGSVPVLDGVRELAEDGLVPGGTRRNQDFFADFVAFADGIDDVARTILFDAQTSGGLVITIRDGTTDLVEDLRSQGVEAVVIGRTTSAHPGHIKVL
jgi:selenide,water dikinase